VSSAARHLGKTVDSPVPPLVSNIRKAGFNEPVGCDDFVVLLQNSLKKRGDVLREDKIDPGLVLGNVGSDFFQVKLLSHNLQHKLGCKMKPH
jgi:hypothetical protein